MVLAPLVFLPNLISLLVIPPHSPVTKSKPHSLPSEHRVGSDVFVTLEAGDRNYCRSKVYCAGTVYSWGLRTINVNAGRGIHLAHSSLENHVS